MIMTGNTGAAGLAALALCESMLLSLVDNKVIDTAEAKGILEDAAAVHRQASTLGPDSQDHETAAALIERILINGDAVRRP